MNEEEKNSGQLKPSAPYATVAGVLFIAGAAAFTLMRIQYLKYGILFNFYAYAWIASCLFTAVVMMLRPKNILPALCFVLLSVFDLYDLSTSNRFYFASFISSVLLPPQLPVCCAGLLCKSHGYAAADEKAAFRPLVPSGGSCCDAALLFYAYTH